MRLVGYVSISVNVNQWGHHLLLYNGWWITTSQVDLPSLTPLPVAVCGGVQIGAAHWATSVALPLEDCDPENCGCRFSSGLPLDLRDFTF